MIKPVAESITDQIGKLAELHKSGILGDEEFSEKKTELLKRM
ncbi:MAG: SHOCT domain-containing protein [Acidobacteriota bacterium]|nr:SHOCT domain-containing protein [Acidobacteriota bacterium]